MDFQALTEQLPSLRAEAQRWRQEAAEATAKAENIEHIIRGIEGLTGELQPSGLTREAAQNGSARSDTGGLRGIAAVRSVMRSDPSRVWRARDVHEIMEISPGAQHPLRGTEAAINRLMHRGELVKLDAGRYRWNSSGEELLPQD
jgi:hypothetical protein